MDPRVSRPRRTSSFRACRRPSADSQSVDVRRDGPDAGSPRCHVPLPRRTAGRSTSQRSLSTGLTAARRPSKGPTPKGMDPRVSRPRRTSSSRACRGPSADSQSVDARRGGPDAGSPRCHVPLPRRTAGRSTSQRSLSTGGTIARHPSKGPNPKGMDPRASRPVRTSSFRACRRPSADSQSVDARRGGPDAGSPRCHVPLPRRTAGRSTS
jgi:hypothetical protein